MSVSGAELERVRPSFLKGIAWEEVKNCGIPLHQLYVAINKDIPTVPEEVARDYSRQVASRPHNVLALCGDIGVGKTVLAIRYLIKKVAEGYSPPIFLPSYVLEGIMRGEIIIVRYEHDLVGYATEFVSVYSRPEGGEVVPVRNLANYYKVIVLDDLEPKDSELLNLLVEQVYQTGSFLVITTNLRPHDFYTLLRERALSRMEQIGLVLEIKGFDLRKRRWR